MPLEMCIRDRTNEISLFAGLIKCGECGKSLTIRYTNAKHPQRVYSCKTYNAFGKNHYTQHRIDYDTLYSHVLRDVYKRQISHSRRLLIRPLFRSATISSFKCSSVKGVLTCSLFSVRHSR